MISLEQIKKVFSSDTINSCIEIEFKIVNHELFNCCFMGKMPDKTESNKTIYWYGLLPDGSLNFDYNSFDGFFEAKIFDGKALEDIWNKIEIISIDGCTPEQRINHYIK